MTNLYHPWKRSRKRFKLSDKYFWGSLHPKVAGCGFSMEPLVEDMRKLGNIGYEPVYSSTTFIVFRRPKK